MRKSQNRSKSTQTVRAGKEIKERIAIAKAARLKREVDELKRAHGQETDDEREARLKREHEKQQEEEDKLMAVSLMAEEEAAKKKAEDERFEKEHLSPVQGVLYHTQFETTSYR